MDSQNQPNPPSAAARAARYARSRHRARSHEQAHDDTPAAPRARIKHPLVPTGEAGLIQTQGELSQLLTTLRQAGRFAYDSEFIGELTYVPKLCLVQVATSEQVALIDPLADVDLTGFWELLADPTVEKIVHAGAQDVEPVHRNIGTRAANIFDTQIAAGFVQMAYPVSLLKLVHELVGVRLGKGLTFTHWDQRPLSAMQLRYAADDVRYLVACHDELVNRLTSLGRLDWARQECDAMCDPSLYEFDPETDFQRIRGSGSLEAQGLSILKHLASWRDSAARLHDVPPRALVKDEVLIDLSRKPAKTPEKLSAVRGLPRPVEVQHGQEILTAIQTGIADARNMTAEKHVEPTPTERFRADALWAAAQARCIGQSIDSALVTSRQEVSEFLRAVLEGTLEQANLRMMRGWRRAALGEPLLRLMQGEDGMLLRWTDHTLQTQPTPLPPAPLHEPGRDE